MRATSGREGSKTPKHSAAATLACPLWRQVLGGARSCCTRQAPQSLPPQGTVLTRSAAPCHHC